MVYSLRSMIQTRWYAAAAFAAAITSGFLWYVFPDVGEWALLPAVMICLPMILIWSRENVLKPGVHVAVLIFMITATVGIWTSYNTSMAVDKVWVLLGAILLFYAAAYQPFENIPFVILTLGIIGGLFAIYFSLTYDWRANPVDTAIVNQIGAQWMNFRPNFQFPALLDDIAGGIFAVLLPLMSALCAYGIQMKETKFTLPSAVAGMLIFTGLLLSGLRAAWGAIAAAILLTLLLVVLQPKLLRYSRKVFRNVTGAFLLLCVIGAIVLFGIISGDILPGLQSNAFIGSIRSRFGLFRDGIDLAGDVFLIGGGLAAFPGLYSRYVLGILDYYYAYSHNLYLDILIEQGVLGLISFLTISFFSLWKLSMHRFNPLHKFDRYDIFTTGVMVSLLTLMIQGVFENSLYGIRATPFVFLFQGLAFSVVHLDRRVEFNELVGTLSVNRKRTYAAYAAGAVLTLSLFVVFNKPLFANIYANLGVVRMAKVELKGWPESRPDQMIYEDGSLTVASEHLYKALEFHPLNRTANYQLGRIEMERRNYQKAIEYFERAFSQDQHYHGIRKNLGYSLVFDGQIEKAHQILRDISEAEYEMTIYNWWWGTQGRDDLANYAMQFVNTIP
jgi:tetratricopeptide (TPR) repeat protein